MSFHVDSPTIAPRLRPYEFQRYGAPLTGPAGPVGVTGPRGEPGLSHDNGATGWGVAAISGPLGGQYTVLGTDGSTTAVTAPALSLADVALPTFAPSQVSSGPGALPCYYNPASATLVTGNRVSLEVLAGTGGAINPHADVTVIRGSGVYTLDSAAYADAGVKRIIWEATGSYYSDDTSPFGGGISAGLAVASTGTTLVVGGTFTTANYQSASRIAAFDTTTQTWRTASVFGAGLNNTCNALAVTGSALIVGGNFTTAGSLPCSYFATFNLSNNAWSIPYQTGVNGPCYALACTGSMVYVGGDFTAVNGVTCNRVARFNLATNTWSFPAALGNPGLVGGPCQALKVVGNTLYCGGAFTSADGNTGTRYLAAFDLVTNTWSNPFGALNGGVRAIDSFGTDLYAGGDFTAANGNACNYILKHDTLTQTTGKVPHLSGTLGGSVYCIRAVGPYVYVGGAFGDPYYGLARIEPRVNGAIAPFYFASSVLALASIGSRVYPVGLFSTGITEVDETRLNPGAQVIFTGGSLLHDGGAYDLLAPWDASFFVRCKLVYMGSLNAWAIMGYRSDTYFMNMQP